MSAVSEVRLTVPLTEGRDHIEGSADAPVTLVEYGDFECPYSGRAYPILKQVRERMGDRLRFGFRNFPLARIHPHAAAAAEAAEAAGGQGRFWEMHDQLFEHQDRLEDADLHGYAAELGLDVERFDQELAAHTYAPRVEEDLSGGDRSGVNGTPAFYINDVRYDGSYQADDLIAALEEAERQAS